MKFDNKNTSDLLSKNPAVSMCAAENIVNSADIEAFKELCLKSEFIFDFIKEKISKNLCRAVNGENFQNIFKFTKIYNRDFEDFIVKSWVNFADEDLTDKILELFNTGTKEEMAYAASYFYHINDSLAIEHLNKFAFSGFEPLAQNCAAALRRFNDREIYQKSIEIIQNSEVDDFDKYKYVNFLVSYYDKEALPTLFEYFKMTGMKSFAAQSILYLFDFNEFINSPYQNEGREIFDAVIGAYPEEISADTVFDFGVFNYIKHLAGVLKNGENPYIQRLILKAKYKFNLIAENDIYTFDLDKNTKEEIKSIARYLNSLEYDLFKGIAEELESDDKNRVLETFNVILNYAKSDMAQDIAKTVNSSSYEDVMAEGVRVLKEFQKTNLVNKEEILAKIKNETLRAVMESYF